MSTAKSIESFERSNNNFSIYTDIFCDPSKGVKIKALEKPSSLLSFLAFFINWAFIFAASFFGIKNLLFLPLSLLFIGSRQRGLSNLVHDASHMNLFHSKEMNIKITNLMAAFCMFDTIEAYRKNHLLHHQHLGSFFLDPDEQSHRRYNYDLYASKGMHPLMLYLNLILSKKAWIDSFFGSLAKLSKIELKLIALWWIIFCLFLLILFGFKNLIYIIFFWFLSKASFYHCIRIFSEFLDHSGLINGDIIKYTRNMPHYGICSFFLHPHSDTFHLLHHLFPRIPHYNLKEAEVITGNIQCYKLAHHCDSYFFGKHPAIKCWVGTCEKKI